MNIRSVDFGEWVFDLLPIGRNARHHDKKILYPGNISLRHERSIFFNLEPLELTLRGPKETRLFPSASSLMPVCRKFNASVDGIAPWVILSWISFGVL